MKSKLVHFFELNSLDKDIATDIQMKKENFEKLSSSVRNPPVKHMLVRYLARGIKASEQSIKDLEGQLDLLSPEKLVPSQRLRSIHNYLRAAHVRDLEGDRDAINWANNMLDRLVQGPTQTSGQRKRGHSVQENDIIRPPTAGWRTRVVLLSMWYSIRGARKQRFALRQSVGEKQWKILLARAEESLGNLALKDLPDQLRSVLFSPESMLCHPLLVHHIRAAARFAKAAGYVITAIPIIATPLLNLVGRADRLKLSNLGFVEIPLGLIFVFRELGCGILNLHQAIQYERQEDIELFARTCSTLVYLLNQPASVIFDVAETLFKETPFKHKLFAVQTTQIITAFVILREIGHICKNHNIDPINEEESNTQEYEVDIFAMECLLTPRKENPRYLPFRKIEIIMVCNFLSLMALEIEGAGPALSGYPSFSDRRQRLLRHFAYSDIVTDEVVEAISDFERAIQQNARFDLQL